MSEFSCGSHRYELIQLTFCMVMLQKVYLKAMSDYLEKYLRGKYSWGLESRARLPRVDYAAFRAMGQAKVQLLNIVYWLRSKSSLDLKNRVYMN